jgi:hypothetical protein
MTAEDDQSLPEMRDAVLDAAALAALLRDIGTLTTIDEVIVKDRPGLARAPSTDVALDQVQRLLLAGEVRGVQIRYRHGGAIWWDTLMATPDGVRLVRIRHEIA